MVNPLSEKTAQNVANKLETLEATLERARVATAAAGVAVTAAAKEAGLTPYQMHGVWVMHGDATDAVSDALAKAVNFHVVIGHLVGKYPQLDPRPQTEDGDGK